MREAVRSQVRFQMLFKDTFTTFGAVLFIRALRLVSSTWLTVTTCFPITASWVAHVSAKIASLSVVAAHAKRFFGFLPVFTGEGRQSFLKGKTSMP